MTSQTTTSANPAVPHVRLERRLEQPLWLQILSPFILLGVALLFGAVLLRMVGANPWAVYSRMASLAFGDAYGWSDTTLKATPLILAGLGVSLAFRMRLWNIGAEGQLYAGAVAAQKQLFKLEPIVRTGNAARMGLHACVLGSYKTALMLRGVIETNAMGRPLTRFDAEDTERVRAILEQADLL